MLLTNINTVIMSDYSCPLPGDPNLFVGGVHYVYVHALLFREMCVW